MQALEKLGLRFKEQISLDELLSENFNARLYGLSELEEDKVTALRDVIKEYISTREDMTGKEITKSEQAAMLARGKLRQLEHEEFWVAFLNRANTVLSFEMLFKGALDSVNISHRDVIARALSKGASNIIVFHNHPSGCPTPSTADIEQTRHLQRACKMMEIGMLDHIIVSPSCYFSFADEATTKYRK